MSNYQFVLYKHNESRLYRVGEAVYVWLKSQYSTGRAVVLATPDSVPRDSPFAGRYLVRFSSCGSTAHVRPDRLLPVYQQQHVLRQQQQCPAPQLQQEQQQHSQAAATAGQQHVVQDQQQLGLQQAVQQLHLDQQPATAPAQQQQHAQQHNHQHPQQQQDPQQQQQEGLVLLVHSTVDFRRLARSQVQSCDGVLELGCSFGVCSRMLQQHAAWLLGVDNGHEVILEARRRNPGIDFQQVDVLQEQHTLLQLAGICTCSSNSSGGSSCSGHSSSAHGPTSSALTGSSGGSRSSGGGGCRTAAGVADGCGCGVQQRSPPCSVVFADIGGNRQLESLVQLVPWVLRAVRPRLLVVKSEELAAAAERQVVVEQAQQQQQHLQAQELQRQQQPQEQEHEQQEQQGQLRYDGVVSDVAGWWQQLEEQCGNPASLAEPWFVAARAGGFSRNPMRYPQRSTADGVRICRPHNYDRDRGCLKADSGCPFDHAHCHHCLQPDHRAVDCPVH